MKTLVASFSYKGNPIDLWEDPKNVFTGELICLRYGQIITFSLASPSLSEAVKSAKEFINRPLPANLIKMQKLSEEQVQQRFEQLGFPVSQAEIQAQLDEIEELQPKKPKEA